jgi:hypothetical protein
MKKARILVVIAAILLGAVFPAGSQGIDSLTLRLNAGVGYTVIDLPTALGWDEQYFEDWSELDIKGNVQGLFMDLGPITLGAELGYNRLYYYYVRVPYLPSPLIYEKSVGPVSLSILGAFEVFSNFFVQAVLGPYFFDDGVTIGIGTSAMYVIPIRENMGIPVAAYADVVFGDGTPIAVGLTAGLQYTLSFDR